MTYKILLILATGGSLCFASESLTKKAKTNILMPPPLPSHVVLPPVYHTFSQEYQELLTRIMRLPSYPKKRIMSYLLGDGHFLRFISNRIDFPSYVLQHESAVFSADFNRAGDKIVSGSEDGSVRIWDLTTREYKVFTGHTREVWSVSFNRAGNKMVTGSQDRTVRVWDLTTGECKVFAGHAGEVESASFNAAGDTIVTGAEDGTVRVWDNATGECRVFHGHRSRVNKTCFNEAGDQIASASDDSTVRVWHLTTGDCKVFEHYSDDQIYAVCFAEGDTKVVSSTDDNIRIWDLATGEFLERMFWSAGHRVHASINLAKARLVTANYNDLMVFDITGDDFTLCRLYGHAHAVRSVKFNEAGDKLVSASDDTVRMWDLSEFERFKESSLIEWVLVLKAIYEVVIARSLKEEFTEEWLVLNQYFPTPNRDDMYFKFSIFGEELKVLLETSYEKLPPLIKKIFNEYILSE